MKGPWDLGLYRSTMRGYMTLVHQNLASSANYTTCARSVSSVRFAISVCSLSLVNNVVLAVLTSMTRGGGNY